MTLVAPRDCTNKAEGRMYLSSRRGVKRAGIVGAGGPPALSRLVAENSIVVDDARAFPDQALALQIREPLQKPLASDRDIMRSGG
jgi:hypothetical protein